MLDEHRFVVSVKDFIYMLLSTCSCMAHMTFKH